MMAFQGPTLCICFPAAQGEPNEMGIMPIPRWILPFMSCCILALAGCSEGSGGGADTAMQEAPPLSEGHEEAKPVIEPFLPKGVPTVKIGRQEWMAADLDVRTYNNGDRILEARTDEAWERYGQQMEGCYRVLPNGTFVYSGYAITDSRGILPDGFQVPSHDDFKALFRYLGGGDTRSGKATQAMTTYTVFLDEWEGDADTGGLTTVEVPCHGRSGFNARLGGFVYDNGSNGYTGNCSYWWSSTISGEALLGVDIGYCSSDVGSGWGHYTPGYGLAVRGIRK